MGSLGPLELILIFLVVLLIFGAKRIPEIARGIGKGIREFKDATNEVTRELDMESKRQEIDARPPQQGAPQARNAQNQQQAPPEPARADNPGDEPESKQESA